MILIVGACASGKRAFAKTLGYTDADMSPRPEDGCPVLFDLQDAVEEDPANAMALLPLLEKKAVVICNEVGAGVIPADAHKRMAREQTGRLCCALAVKAEQVYRLVAGLPQRIK